jgi:hypothetical protein
MRYTLKFLIFILVTVMLLAMGACGFREETDETPLESTTPVPSPSDEVPSPEPVVKFTNPLTGEATETDISNQRPFAIMINNLNAAQPQCGISAADIIYEVPVEGNITRMMAVYQDVTHAGVIGSLRSCRPYYLDLALGLDAIYIHAGGSPEAYERLYTYDVDNVDGVNGGEEDIFYRDEARLEIMDYEHTLMTSGDLICQYVPTYDIRMEHEDGYQCNLTFAEDGSTMSGNPASNITVEVTPEKSTSFVYDSTSKKYTVEQYGDEYKDGNNDEPFTPANILVLRTEIYTLDDYGRLHVELEGSGTGYLFCSGKYHEIQWSKDNIYAPFVYTYTDGTPVELNVGKSYICITYDSSSVSFS